MNSTTAQHRPMSPGAGLPLPGTTEEVQFAREIVTYREGVETLMRLKSNTTISNSAPSHAAVLFEVFFRNAQSDVRIFCQKLSACVFDQPAVVDAAKALLKTGKKITVIHQEEKCDNSALLTELGKCTNAVMQAPLVARKLAYNFAVMDARSYRIEPDAHAVEKKARANMYDPENAKKLVHRFDQFVIMAGLERSASQIPEPA